MVACSVNEIIDDLQQNNLLDQSVTEPQHETEINNFDFANYSDKHMSDAEKRYIIGLGAKHPKITFPRDPMQNNRSFSSSNFFKQFAIGKTVRYWLSYSPKLDAVYCEPCWLFAIKDEVTNNWHTGIRKWKNLSNKINFHEKSAKHLTACLTYNIWIPWKCNFRMFCS